MKALLVLAALGIAYHLQSDTEKPKDMIGSDEDTTDPLFEPRDFEQVPNHPYCVYAIELDACEDGWIVIKCGHCNDEWRRKCSDPSRIEKWIYKYSLLHAHGHYPTLRSKLDPKPTGDGMPKGCTLH